MNNNASEKPEIKFIKDSDYKEYMSDENPKWRSEYVKQGDFVSFDGMKLRYYHASQDKDKETVGTIVMLHGYCGFGGSFMSWLTISGRRALRYSFSSSEVTDIPVGRLATRTLFT